MQSDVGLDVKITFLFFFSVKHSSVFLSGVGEIIFIFSDTKPVTSAACNSPRKASATPGLFHSSYLRKVEKYSCVVRWISRLYSLQCFPLNSLSAIPETTTSPCLLPVPGKYEVECLLTITFHLVSLTSKLCPLVIFEKSQSKVAQFSVEECRGGWKVFLWLVPVWFLSF